MSRRWLQLLLILGVLDAASPHAFAPQAGLEGRANTNEHAERPFVPPALARRLVHAFRFEEAERAPVQMPPGFYRHVATDKGFPPYGHTQLSDATAAGGNWSFEFSLDTGSLAARVPTTVIPVLPLADYTVTVMVRTDGLTESRARVVAWFNDENGNAIAASRMASRPLLTKGRWEHITISMAGQFPDAVDLSIELQLVQPQHYQEPGRGASAATVNADPKIEDVAGKAWFDDVCVWQVPRIELATSSPVNVITPTEPAVLSVLVRDLTSESLTGRLDIEDIDRNVVMSTEIPSANDPRPTEIDISQLPFGWYRATFELRRMGSTLTRRELEFIIAAPAEPRDLRQGTQFAVDLRASDVVDHSKPAAKLLQRLGCDIVAVPIWTPALAAESNKAWAEHLRTFVDELFTRRIEATFVLPVVPEALARVAQVDSSQVIALLRRDPALWRPYLDDLIISFGLQIRRWQLGDRLAEEFGWRAEPSQALEDITGALGQLIAGPTIVVTWPAVEELPPDFAPDGLAIEVPYQLPPASLLDYAERWRREGTSTSIALQPLPRDAFLPRQRLADVAQRVLYGWRARFDEIAVEAPWRINGQRRIVVQPDPVYVAFQRLALELAQHEFITELDLMDDVEAWLLRNTRNGTGVVVAWSTRANADHVTLRALLADQPVTVRDLFGNERRIGLAAGDDDQHPLHAVPLSNTPTFIDDVSLGLAQFRADFAFLPTFIEAEHRLHEHAIVIENPWEFTITGTLRIEPPEGWRINPRTHEITLAPGQQLRLPIDVVLERSVLGGVKPIHIDVRLIADREYHFNQTIDLEVGLREIDFSAHWSLVPNESSGAVDLIISQYVTNRGDRPLNLSTYVTAPELSQRRRMIGGLEPGQTIVRHFRIDRGAETMAGKTIHVGVAEQNGSARLRKALDIPAQSTNAMTAHTSDE